LWHEQQEPGVAVFSVDFDDMTGYWRAKVRKVAEDDRDDFGKALGSVSLLLLLPRLYFRVIVMS
jgi:hypothetical protein